MIQCFGLLLVMWCEDPAAARAPALRCPPLVEYAPADQAAAAAQLRALPAGSPARRLVQDYGDLRARCRALEAR